MTLLKGCYLVEIFILAYEKFAYKISFLYKKVLLQIIFLWGKKPKWNSSYEYTYIQHIKADMSFVSYKMLEKWDGRVTNVHLSKQMFLFHLFLPFILSYVKKYAQSSECYCYYIPYMFSIFINIMFECYNLLMDLVR